MRKLIFTTIFGLILLLLVITPSDAVSLNQRLSGKILLQVQEHGEAWYIYPDDLKRYYLGRPADAFRIMRELGLGISEASYNSFNGYAPFRLSGQILLRVEANGEAYYVNPVDLKMHYLGRPADAFGIMRELGLGITNIDLEKIPTVSGEEDELDTLLPAAVLEENIPEIKDYPKIETVFIDLYGPGGFTGEEIEFMKIALEIYKEKQSLQTYPKKVLYYFAFRFRAQTSPAECCGYNNDFFKETVRKKALELKKESDIETAKSIYEWVNDYLKGRHPPHPQIDEIWASRIGQCTEKSELIAAMLRSLGVPVRIVRSDFPSHKWVEIYSDEKWIPIPSTGVLDIDKDGLVDITSNFADDVEITYFLENIDINKKASYFNEASGEYNFQSKNIGYKYSNNLAKSLIKIASENEFKNSSLQFINKWEESKDWGEREYYGELALKEAVSALFEEDKKFYIQSDILYAESLQPNSVFLGIIDGKRINWLDKWGYYKNEDSILRYLFEKDIRNISIILFDRTIKDLTVFYSTDLDNLFEEIEKFAEYSPEVILNLLESLTKIQANEIQETTMDLPDIEQAFITGMGLFREEGFAWYPMIGANKNIKGIEIAFNQEAEPAMRDIEFSNIKFLDETGNIVVEPKAAGYYESCPANLRIPFGQTLLIQREGDYIVIKGDMSLEE